MINQGINCSANNPQFTGRVDKSVKKYVKVLKDESKKMYLENCKKTGIAINPDAFRCIDERCDTAFLTLERKSKLLHDDTVIKVLKNPYNKNDSLYLSAENKNVTQEWEQKGAVNLFNIYKNDLRCVSEKDKTGYDKFIVRFEYMANKINPENLDKQLVRNSISNLWNLSKSKILNTGYSNSKLKATSKMAKEIDYPNTTFVESLNNYYNDVRHKANPKKKSFLTRLFKKSNQ